MKKVSLIIFAIVLVVAAVLAWMVMGSGTAFSDNKSYIYLHTGKANKAALLQFINEKRIVKNPRVFTIVADQMDLWDRLKPGRFEVSKGESVLTIVRRLRNNQQSPVKLVINKVRTNEELGKLVGKNFETSEEAAIRFYTSNDSLQQFGVDTHTLMTLVIPNTYSILWTSSPAKVLQRLKREQENFWERNERAKKAEQLGLSTKQVYIIASIVEEETNKQEDKGNIASVYVNRIEKGMPLGADPTIKFAMKDFSLKRIYHKHLQVESPYNTYRNPGLPPGPICTPSPKTIDAVLEMPKTDYIFFVAKSDFSGHHVFTSNYAEHQQYAKEYQKALDAWMERQQNK